MELSTWELGTIFTHLFSYFGMCALVGGGFVRLMCKQSIKLDLEFRQLIMIVCGCAFITTAAGFFIHVGAFSESGFIGMWDAEVISILWDSEIGDSTLVRLLGFAVGFFVFHFNFSIGGKNDNKKSLSL